MFLKGKSSNTSSINGQFSVKKSLGWFDQQKYRVVFRGNLPFIVIGTMMIIHWKLCFRPIWRPFRGRPLCHFWRFWWGSHGTSHLTWARDFMTWCPMMPFWAALPEVRQLKKSIQPSIRCNKLRKLAAETCPSEPRFVLKKINESFHPFCYFWSHLDSGVLSSFMRSHSASHICRAVEWYSPYRWHFRIDDMFDLTMVVSTTTTMHTGCSSLKSYKERGMVALSL